MPTLDKIIINSKKSTMSLDKMCVIKRYLPIEEKFKFIEEYENILKKHKDDYPMYPSYVGFLFFNLMVIKKYTDIEFDLTYESFDKFQERGWIDKIVEFIGSDYTLLLQLIKKEK